MCIWGVVSPEHVRPAVEVVAAHLQSNIQDGVHTQDVCRVEADALRTGNLLQPLLHWIRTQA